MCRKMSDEISNGLIFLGDGRAMCTSCYSKSIINVDEPCEGYECTGCGRVYLNTLPPLVKIGGKYVK